MSIGRIVILDVEADRACAGNCGRIGSLVQEVLAPERVTLTALSHLPAPSAAAAPDLVLLHIPSHRPVRELLDPLRKAWPRTPVLGSTCGWSRGSAELAASLAEASVDDFLCCPVAPLDLSVRLRRLLADRRARRAERVELVRDLQLDMLVGDSRAFLEAARRILLAARSSATVLIGGETGVGKGLFARAVHYNGARRARPFVPVNCSAVPDHLLENELFGHARGAYTDASEAQRGLVAEAEGGTIFLDEVDTLSPASQAKLLRLLQDREYRPLGSSRTFVADVRVIAATNADLACLVRARSFRQDLYHRLDVLSFTVPSLRDRKSDIPLLARHFLEHCATEYRRPRLRLSRAALDLLCAHGWPGNVRELQSVIQRAVVFSGGEDVIGPDELGLPGATEPAGAPGGSPSLRGAKAVAVDEAERAYLSRLLAAHGGNVSRAAAAGGSHRRTFQRLLRKHGIDRARYFEDRLA